MVLRRRPMVGDHLHGGRNRNRRRGKRGYCDGRGWDRSAWGCKADKQSRGLERRQGSSGRGERRSKYAETAIVSRTRVDVRGPHGGEWDREIVVEVRSRPQVWWNSRRTSAEAALLLPSCHGGKLKLVRSTRCLPPLQLKLPDAQRLAVELVWYAPFSCFNFVPCCAPDRQWSPYDRRLPAPPCCYASGSDNDTEQVCSLVPSNRLNVIECENKASRLQVCRKSTAVRVSDLSTRIAVPSIHLSWFVHRKLSQPGWLVSPQRVGLGDLGLTESRLVLGRLGATRQAISQRRFAVLLQDTS